VKLPAGVRDWLPAELQRKREVEMHLRGVFGRWAYQELQTPSFERFDVLENGLGKQLAQETFRFVDRRNTGLALRPEMTTPIARLASTRMRDMSLPLRISYVAPAFRYYEQPQEGRMREFTQAGCELIGSPGVDADAEALFMAIETLDEVDLRDAHVDINDAAIVDGLLDGLDVPAPDAARVKTWIGERNVVALRPYGSRLVEFAMLRGGEEALEAARRVCRTQASLAAIERLAVVLQRAAALGYRERVTVDFSLLRDLEYYTGFIFEGYVPELGVPLCGGGRYDSLLPRFGFNVPAVGWSANVERILIALERRGRHKHRKRPRIDVLVAGSDLLAARERAAGNVVRCAAGDLDDAQLLDDARAYGIPRLVVVRRGLTREMRVTPGEARVPSSVDAAPVTL
jgi:ATP phosphoribosyltransferase regulatory subunit